MSKHSILLVEDHRELAASVGAYLEAAGFIVDYTDDPHPRNTYWEMFGMPMFDLKDPAGIMLEINNCRKTFPNHYIRVTAFNSIRGVESPTMSYLVNRPKKEPGFGLSRQEGEGRHIRYTVHSYATDKPEGERY